MTIRLLIGAFLLALLPGFVLACGDDEAAPNTGATVDEIAGDPEPYYGDRVTVSGEVDELVAPNTVSINDLLVIFTEGANPGAINEGDLIQVTGEVRQVIVADLEEDFGLDLDESIFAEWDRQPAVIASTVAVVWVARENDSLLGGGTEQPIGTYVHEILEDTDEWVGTEVLVPGEVTGVLPNGSFILSEEILVVHAGFDIDGFDVAPGQIVAVTGSVRDMGDFGELENDFGEELNGSIAILENEYGDIEGNPMIVATETQSFGN